MTAVRDIGEFGLIERLAKQVADAKLEAPDFDGFRLHLGIGDDAAAWSLASGVEVFTTDTMVQDVHFTLETTPWADVGWKVWAANLSDIASMGGVPLTGVVTLGLPADLPIKAIDELYDGMLDACRCYRTLIVGGDIVGSRDVFIVVGLNGVCEGEPLRRSVARAGDAIAVTGPLGGSGGGLRVLQSGGFTGPSADSLVRAHRRPEPRVKEGRRIAAKGIRCAMDLSDGLLVDLGKLARASGVAARIEAELVPAAPALLDSYPHTALVTALGGGEDYEVLFTGNRGLVERLVGEFRGAAVIGEIVSGEPGAVTVTDSDGDEMGIVSAGSAAGWEHLR